jgi:hypothetical protein
MKEKLKNFALDIGIHVVYAQSKPFSCRWSAGGKGCSLIEVLK